jgi:hypothetical protein
MCFQKPLHCLLFFLILICINSSQIENYSLRDVLDLVQDPKRTITDFTRESIPINFIIKYYRDNPAKSLKWVLNSNCIPFENLFFTAISSGVLWFDIPLASNPTNTFESIIWTCERIRVIVARLFYKPYYSEEEMNRRFSIIKLYIQIAKRYVEYPGALSTSEYNKKRLQELSSRINSWRFVVKFLPIIAPNGKIDYLQFFSIFNRYMRSHRRTFPEYTEEDQNYYFLFATLLNHMCVQKDFKLFEIPYPEVPSLVALMVDNISKYGNCLLSGNFCPQTYYGYLKKYFGREKKFDSLATALKCKKYLVEFAKKELGLGKNCSYSTSLLVDTLERVPPLCQVEDIHNIIWQLKGYTLIKEFLEASRYRKLIKE